MLRPIGQEPQVLLAEGGVVGEGGEVHQFGSRGVEGPLDLPRLGDAGEGDDGPLGRRTGRSQPGDMDRKVTEGLHQFGIDAGCISRQQDDHGVGAGQAAAQLFAHRAGRKHRTVTKGPFVIARLAVDDHKAECLLQGRVLMGVVEDQNLGPGRRRGTGPGDTVMRDPGRAAQRQHQGLVADVGGGVHDGVDLRRLAQRAAIAA